MRVGIIRQKSEVLAEPMVNTRKQRVVGGIAFVRSCRNAREKRSIDGAYLGQRSSGLLVAGGPARTKDRRIGIIPKPQMVGSVAQVTRSHQPVGTELLVTGEIPLHYVRRPQVERQIDVDTTVGEKSVGGSGARLRKWRGQPAFLSVCETAHRSV